MISKNTIQECKMKLAIVGNIFNIVFLKKNILKLIYGLGKGKVTFFDTVQSDRKKYILKKIICSILGIKYVLWGEEQSINEYNKILIADRYAYSVFLKMLLYIDVEKEVQIITESISGLSLPTLFDKDKREKFIMSSRSYECKVLINYFYNNIVKPNSINLILMIDTNDNGIDDDIREIENCKIQLVNSVELGNELLNQHLDSTLILDLNKDGNYNFYHEAIMNSNQYLNNDDIFQMFDFVRERDFCFDTWLNENILCIGHYKKIALYGESICSKQIFAELSKSGVEITIINSKDITYSNGMYELKNQVYKPEMFVICDLIKLYGESYDNNYIPIVCNGEEIYYFPVSRFFSIQRKNAAIDIAKNIVPTLLEAGVNVMVIKSPNDEEVLQKNKFIQSKTKICNMVPRTAWINQYRLDLQEKFYKENFNKEFIEEILSLEKTRKFGYWMQAEKKGKKYNCIDGIRLTEGNSVKNHNRIIMFGPCWIAGNWVPDNQTISSYLQGLIENYNVENRGAEFIDMNFAIRDTIYHTGDIVIIIAETGCDKTYERFGINLESVASAYENCDDLYNAIWDMPLHSNQLINKLVAEELYNKLRLKQYMRTSNVRYEEVSFNKKNIQKIKGNMWLKNNELKLYIEEIKTSLDINLDNKHIGAIVMNCNPFTKGHMFLIEEARKKVDVLLVFVVEEDKSYFKFEDRIELVRRGTQDMENVYVYPSGNFMISSMTMPSYFLKNSLQDVVLNESDDIELFAGVIAPRLNIRVRFAGSEPIDKFTNNYNLSMKRILPEYGIEFMEIARMADESGMVISASEVRKCLEKHEYRKIKEIVPKSTYDFLKERYFIDIKRES